MSRRKRCESGPIPVAVLPPLSTVNKPKRLLAVTAVTAVMTVTMTVTTVNKT